MSQAYAMGWRRAALWANRDDLIADIDSPAYERDMAEDLATIARTHHAELEEAVSRKPCAWTEDAWDGSWDTACGNKHQFTDGSPSDNKHAFCPYCGRPLIQAMHNSTREE